MKQLRPLMTWLLTLLILGVIFLPLVLSAQEGYSVMTMSVWGSECDTHANCYYFGSYPYGDPEGGYLYWYGQANDYVYAHGNATLYTEAGGFDEHVLYSVDFMWGTQCSDEYGDWTCWGRVYAD